MNESTRKALCHQPFQGFEPERSKRVKAVPLNDLTREIQNCNGQTNAVLRALEFDTISTINRSDRAHHLSLAEFGAMQ